MKLKSLAAATALAISSYIGVSSTTYQVDEKEQVVVTRFGKPVRVILGANEPGLRDDISKAHDTHDVRKYNAFREWNDKQKEKVDFTIGAGLRLKRPFDAVNRFDDRVMLYASSPRDIVTRDKKALTVSNYAAWRIDNPLLFMYSVRTEAAAQARLDDIVYSSVREAIGKQPFIEIIQSTPNKPAESGLEAIKSGREKVMEEVTSLSAANLQGFGINIVDVRIKHAELPPENKASIYGRMRSERQSIAKQYRSEGEEQATKIKADADREAKVIVSEAYAEAEKARGDGDASATKLYNTAANKDPQFFKFWRTMQAYDEAFKTGSTKVLLKGDSAFNDYLNGPK